MDTTNTTTLTVHTYSEIITGGPDKGRTRFVREWRNAKGQCNRFEIFAVR